MTLASRALQVRDETGFRLNTANRVGGLMVDMVSALSLYIDPCQPEYGAVGDGVTDDLGAWLLAISAAVATGKVINGKGLTYGISGNLVLIAGANIQDCTFKQLSPAGSTRRTLTSAGGDRITLRRVTVNRNGTGEYGVHQQAAGIYIDGGSNHLIEDCEVYGHDIGVGIVLINVSDSDIVGAWVHDIRYLLVSDPGNDRVMGLYFSACTRVRIVRCRAQDLGGDYGTGYTLEWSRGFGFAGCTGIQLSECVAYMVDQGYDTTGGGATPNTRFQFSDSFAIDCRIYGFKFANTARDGQVDNCTAERAGLSGFIASGPSGEGATGIGTSDIQFTNCVAYDTGGWVGPGTPESGGKIGFRVSYAGYEPDTLLGIRFVGCKAHDRQGSPTMTYGFAQDVGLDAPSDGRYNEVVNCVSIGHTAAAFLDMMSPRCELGRSAVQSHTTTGAWEAVEWTTDVDLGAMHSTSSNKDNVYVRREGVYTARFGVVFAASATGQRGVRILKDGGVVAGTTVLVDAAASGETALHTSWTSTMSTGSNLRVEAFQSSGGALNIQTTSGGVVEEVG